MCPNVAPSTACTDGAHATGCATRWIMFGYADVMDAGAQAPSTSYNEDPSRGSRPFDHARSGFVIGEESGIVVLEEYERAKPRCARIYAELAGYGASAPPEDGSGAALSMARALSNAWRSIHDVLDELVVCALDCDPFHAGDLAETRAVKALFKGGAAANLAVSFTKVATGHLPSGAGAVEAIFTILSVFHNILPPSLNLHNLGPELDLDFVTLIASEKVDGGVQVAMTNSFGFGGTNASLEVVVSSV
ncbi:thiolase-like protein [Cladochytrium replicatum]|nr:thiolase-like protein [Cladochytrium replicatum]